MGEVRVDTAQVKQKIARFQATIDDLAKHEAKVSQIAGDLSGSCTSQTGSALQKALTAYNEAVADLRKEQQDILDRLNAATAQYDAADSAGAGSLASQMHI